MADQTLRAVITVLDRTAAPLHAINQRFAAMSAPLRQIGDRLGTLAEESGLRAIGEHAQAALGHVRRLGEGLLHLAAPLAALGGVASLAGLAEIAVSAGEFAEKLDIGAVKTGLSTEQLAGWHYAAGLVNVDVEKLDKGFERLNRNIAEAAMGKAKDLERIFARMGFRNTQAHMISTTQALQAFSAETKRLVDSGQIQLASAMLSKAFGARQGADLVGLFAQGPEAITRAMREAAEAGISLSSAQTGEGRAFMERYKFMKASVEGLKIAIGAGLFPVLKEAAEGMSSFLNTNRAEIAVQVGDAVRSLGEWLRSIDWAAVRGGASQVWNALRDIWTAIGGAKGALAIFIGMSFAPLLTQLALVGVAFARMGATVALAMAATPIGQVILALGLLAWSAYQVSQHWEQMWTNLKATAIAGGDLVKAAVGAFGRWFIEWADSVAAAIIAPFRASFEWIANHLPHLPGFSSAVPEGGAGMAPTAGIYPPSGTPGTKSEVRVDLNLKLPPGVSAEPHVTTSGNPDWGMNLGTAMPF